MWWCYVDGACIRNGQPDAAAGYGVFFGNKHDLNVSKVVRGKKHSSQIAELQAARAAIEIAIEEEFDGLKIYTDSNYVYMGITKWIKKWKRHGWRTYEGGPVANQDEWEKLENAVDDFMEICYGNIDWIKIKAHSGNFGNNEADRLAREAAQEAFENNQRRRSKK